MAGRWMILLWALLASMVKAMAPPSPVSPPQPPQKGESTPDAKQKGCRSDKWRPGPVSIFQVLSQPSQEPDPSEWPDSDDEDIASHASAQAPPAPDSGPAYPDPRTPYHDSYRPSGTSPPPAPPAPRFPPPNSWGPPATPQYPYQPPPQPGPGPGPGWDGYAPHQGYEQSGATPPPRPPVGAYPGPPVGAYPEEAYGPESALDFPYVDVGDAGPWGGGYRVPSVPEAHRLACSDTYTDGVGPRVTGPDSKPSSYSQRLLRRLKRSRAARLGKSVMQRARQALSTPPSHSQGGAGQPPDAFDYPPEYGYGHGPNTYQQPPTDPASAPAPPGYGGYGVSHGGSSTDHPPWLRWRSSTGVRAGSSARGVGPRCTRARPAGLPPVHPRASPGHRAGAGTDGRSGAAGAGAGDAGGTPIRAHAAWSVARKGLWAPGEQVTWQAAPAPAPAAPQYEDQWTPGPASDTGVRILRTLQHTDGR
jgi:hypothetical protein